MIPRQVKKGLLLIATFLFSCAGAISQQPTTSPTPDDGVVRVATNLVQVDVTVTDEKGRPVTGLLPSDFEVVDAGRRQTISYFSYHGRSSGEASAGGERRPPAPAAPLPAKHLPFGAVRLSIAIVIDDLNLSFGSVHSTKRALKKFVNEQLQPGDLVAILRTGGGAGGLQQFTSDKRLLHAAIEAIRWNALGGSFDSLASVSQNDQDVSERFERESSLIATGRAKQTTIINTRDYESEKSASSRDVTRNSAEHQSSAYAQTSLGVVRYIIGAMADLPGRKTVLLFSDGIVLGADAAKSRASNTLDEIKKAVASAKDASVVVHTFDTKGMRPMSIGASDSTYEIIDGHRGQKERARTRDFKASQEGLAYFAEQTGGKALLNSDDLNGGIQRAIEQQTGYYLLGYIPADESFDPAKRLREDLQVKVNRSGVSISFRGSAIGSRSSAAQGAERALAGALVSPFAENAIRLQMNALFANDSKDGSYIRSFLHIDPNDLTFSEAADGWKKATFDVSAVAFGANGSPLERRDAQYTIKTKGATYQAMLRQGFMYVLIVPFKNAGVYQYRVALRDSTSGKIGSASQVVDIPDLGKGKLTISSVAVEGVSRATWEKISQGKIGPGPGQTQVASTLLYDTVLKQFPAGTVLRYGFEVYNTKRDGTARSHLETQVKILQNDRAIFNSKVANVTSTAQPGPVRFSNALMLRDTLPVGDYVLQVIVTDTAAKKTATQLFPFEIVK